MPSKTKETEAFQEFWAKNHRNRDERQFLSTYSDWWEYQQWKRSRVTNEKRID